MAISRNLFGNAGTLIVLCLLLMPLYTMASEPQMKKHVFSFHAGYGSMPWGTSALTIASDSYTDKLCSGFAGDLQYDYRINPLFAIGAIVSQYNANGSHDEGSDHIYSTLLAPQVSLYPMNGIRWVMRLSFGVGYFDYKNNGKVFGKVRKTYNSTVGTIVGARLSYKFLPQWGINADANLVSGSLGSYKAKYHGYKIKVKLNEGNRIKLSRYNISAGISYHF